MLREFRKIYDGMGGRLVQGIIVSLTICIVFELTTSNILYLMVAAMYIAISQDRVELEVREKWVSRILSFAFSIFMVLGKIEAVLAVEFLFFWPITVIVCVYGFYLCFAVLLSRLLVYLRKVDATDYSRECSKRGALFAYLLSFLGMAAMWGIGMAVSYPGNTTSDSNDIIYTALGINDMKSMVPVVYVLFIRLFWNLGYAIFGNVNASLAVCTTMHVLVISSMISYLISRLYKYGVKKWICLFVWLFYAVVPYNVQLCHTIWKDIPFAAFVFFFSILLWEQYEENGIQSALAESVRLSLLLISAMGICLMRNNGFFAYIFFLPFGIYLFYKKNKKVVVTLLVAFVLVRIVQGPVYDKVMTNNAIWVNELKNDSVEEEDANPNKEMFVVKNATDSYNSTGVFIITIQQLARVAVDREDISAEDYVRLNRIINIEEIKETYDPYCRDAAGWAMDRSIGTAEYLKEWVYFGLKYPVQYVLAYKDQTFGYWYPDIQHWIYTDQIRENDIGLYKDSVLTEDGRYEMMLFEGLYKDIPLYGLLWSIGFVVWITLFSMGVALLKRGKGVMLLYTPVLAVWLTLLVATPVYAEFRYIYSMFLCLPLSVLLPFLKNPTCDGR